MEKSLHQNPSTRDCPLQPKHKNQFMTTFESHMLMNFIYCDSLLCCSRLFYIIKYACIFLYLLPQFVCSIIVPIALEQISIYFI